MSRRTVELLAAVSVLAALLAPAPGAAQAFKVGVIDSDRIVAESIRGKAALGELKKLQDQKLEEGRTRQQEINELRKRIDEGQLSLAPERLEEMRKELEDRVIAFRRFQDDADRDLGKLRDTKLGEIERQVLKVINGLGDESAYTLIFNKFRSGLVYADEAVDLTDQVIQRFDAISQGG